MKIKKVIVGIKFSLTFLYLLFYTFGKNYQKYCHRDYANIENIPTFNKVRNATDEESHTNRKNNQQIQDIHDGRRTQQGDN